MAKYPYKRKKQVPKSFFYMHFRWPNTFYNDSGYNSPSTLEEKNGGPPLRPPQQGVT